MIPGYIPIIYYHNEFEQDFILVDSFYVSYGRRGKSSQTIAVGKLENHNKPKSMSVNHEFRLKNIKRIPVWCRCKGDKLKHTLPRNLNEPYFNRIIYVKKLFLIFCFSILPFLIILFYHWKTWDKPISLE